jgi:signal transduction histidine kinase
MSIQGYLSLLQMTADPDSKNYTYLKKIEEHVEKGASLTRQMLGVSFSESGFSAPCCTDMNDLMKKIASDFLKNRQNINLSLLADSAPCFAMCDTAQMENVFSNILDNSVQAMENGGTITISTENVFCDEKFVGAFSNTRPGRYVLVSVTDNGSGMDEKTQRRIFNPFFTTRDTGRSSGIGLTSAFGIIKNHAGFITINSQLGVGTTVFVYLPAFENRE